MNGMYELRKTKRKRKRFTQDEVIEINRRWHVERDMMKNIAVDFSTTHTSISKMVNGKTYKNLRTQVITAIQAGARSSECFSHGS